MTTEAAYPLPNMRLGYFDDVADLMAADGAPVDDGHVAFVGGQFYAHAYKADHPNATVTVVEEQPLSAYYQSFAAYQLDRGYDREDVERLVLAGEETPPEGASVDEADPDPEWVRERHEAFVESEWSAFDRSILSAVAPETGTTTFEPEPEESEREFLRRLAADATAAVAEPDGEDTSQGLVGRATDAVDRLLSGSSGGPSEAADPGVDLDAHRFAYRVCETVVETGEYDEERVEELRDRYGIEDGASVARDVHYALLRHAGPTRDDGGVADGAALADTDLNLQGNWAIFDEADDLAPVDEVVVDDVRDVDLDADVVFTNNVFDYLPDYQVAATVEAITDEDGGYVESATFHEDPGAGGAPVDDAETVEPLAVGPSDVEFWTSVDGETTAEAGHPGVRVFRPVDSEPDGESADRGEAGEGVEP